MVMVYVASNHCHCSISYFIMFNVLYKYVMYWLVTVLQPYCIIHYVLAFICNHSSDWLTVIVDYGRLSVRCAVIGYLCHAMVSDWSPLSRDVFGGHLEVEVKTCKV